MPYYRLYFLDAAGRIREMVDMECANDAAAEAVVSRHSHDGRAMELWNQARMVRRYQPTQAA